MNLKLLPFLGLLVLGVALTAQTETNTEGSKYIFNQVKTAKATDVLSQGRTGTCWSFSSMSFLESELMRLGKGNIDLSEMWIVRCAYIEKAINYVRMNGHVNFAQGGEFHDIPYIAGKYGLVPQAVYTGLKAGETTYNHTEMEGVLAAVVNQCVKNPTGLSNNWQGTIAALVDSYLGTAPAKFSYDGKEYSPMEFYKSLNWDLSEYVYVTSFTHHPYYSTFALEIPDNWSMQAAYNVSLGELTDLAKNALKSGYSFAWASDVSEKGFSFKNGLGIVPSHDSLLKQTGVDNKHFNDGGADRAGTAFLEPMEEKKINAINRQEAFDNQSTTDDHGMHAMGLYKDQNGKTYFKVKNSWGTGNYTKGFLYVSENYFEYKTICIMVHKDALNKDLKKKLNIR
jgi:bleomycin hydrolase